MLPDRISRIATCSRPVAEDVAALLARLTIGQAFLLAGIGKLGDLERTSGYFASLGLPAPGVHAVVVGGMESVGGVLLLLGLATRPAAAVLLVLMAGAIATAERAGFGGALSLAPEKGLTDIVPWMFALVLLPLLLHGGGRVAVDAVLRRRACAGHRNPLPASA